MTSAGYMALVGGGAKLPYDAEVEYLESTGTQYIDLDFGFDPTDEVYASISTNIGQGEDKFIVCTNPWNTANNRYGLGASQRFQCAFGSVGTGSTFLSPLTAQDGVIHNWRYKNRVFDVLDNGASFDASSITFGATSPNVRLFYGYNSTTEGKIQSYKHIKNGVVVCDLVSVRFTNELGVSEGAMYDRVSGQLFRNAGTGAFVVGPDTNPISARSYVNDGLIAMWDGIENAGWGVHDPNATVWKDLVGTMPYMTVHDAEFSDKALHRGTSKAGYMAENESAGNFNAGRYDEFTVESCAVLGSNGILIPLSFGVNYGGYEALRISYKSVLNSTQYGVGVRAKGINNLVYTPPWTDMVSGTVSIVDNVGAYYNSVQMTLNPNLSLPPGNVPSGIALGNNSVYNVYGDIYCTRIYSRALTTAEIAANYAIDKQRFNLPDA